MSSFCGMLETDIPQGSIIRLNQEKAASIIMYTRCFSYCFDLPPTGLNPACDRAVCLT